MGRLADTRLAHVAHLEKGGESVGGGVPTCAAAWQGPGPDICLDIIAGFTLTRLLGSAVWLGAPAARLLAMLRPFCTACGDHATEKFNHMSCNCCCVDGSFGSLQLAHPFQHMLPVQSDPILQDLMITACLSSQLKAASDASSIKCRVYAMAINRWRSWLFWSS